MIIRLNDIDVDFPLRRGDESPLINPKLIPDRIRISLNSHLQTPPARPFQRQSAQKKLRYLLHPRPEEFLQHTHDSRLLPGARRSVE